MTQIKPALFHRIADPDSARVRQIIMARGLKAHFDFRNIEYPEAAADLETLGGQGVPSLWTGTELIEGFAAIERHLR